MTLTRKQLLAIVLAAILVVILFIPGLKTSSPGDKPNATQPADQVETLRTFFTHQADSLTHGRWAAMEKNVKDQGGFEDLMMLSDSLGMLGLSALLGEEYATKYPSYKSWVYVANRSINYLESDNNPMGRAYFSKLGESAAEQTLKIKPEDVTAMNYLATAKMTGGTDVMGAVQLLKKVLATDSNNVDATRSLGLLSIESKQWDKALTRFIKLTKLEPLNPEHYYHLGEVQEALGQNQDAVTSYLTCKGLVSDPAFKATLNEKINQIKNQKN